MNERWALIPGFGTAYEVSDQGQVRSYRRPGQHRDVLRPTPRILKQYGERYLHVEIINEDGAFKQPYVHQLVALVFHGACPAGLVVNHKDGDRANNAAVNLEYVTPPQNVEHARLTGLCPRGMNNGGAKLSDDEVREIRQKHARGSGYGTIAKEYGLGKSTVYGIVKRKQWRHIA